MSHVADCLYLLGKKLESVHAEFIKAFSMFSELRPYVDYDRFIFAAGDPYCRAPLFSQRDEAWRVASIIAPHWGRWFQPHEVSTLAIPADDLARVATVVARKAACDGFEAARACASGLVEVRDDRVRQVAVPGGVIRLEFIGDRLFVFAASLLRLADRGVTLEAVEEAVTSAAAKGFPGGALHRSNARMGRGRPPVGSWWLDVVEARSFLAMSGYPTPIGAAATFLDEVDARIKPGMRRDLCSALPQTSADGEAVMGIIIKGKLMPIVVDDVSGLPILSQVQIGSFENSQKRTVAKAAERLGLVLGSPGVSRRRSIALDGKSYVQMHYDMDACLRLAVELRSFKMVSALGSLSSLLGGFGVGQARLEALKAVPAVERVIDLVIEG